MVTLTCDRVYFDCKRFTHLKTKSCIIFLITNYQFFFRNPTFGNSDILQNLKWPKFSSDEAKYVDIGENLEIKNNPKSPYYKAWVQFYDQWAKKPLITF